MLDTTTGTLRGLDQVEVAEQFCQRHDEPDDDEKCFEHRRSSLSFACLQGEAETFPGSGAARQGGLVTSCCPLHSYLVGAMVQPAVTGRFSPSPRKSPPVGKEGGHGGGQGEQPPRRQTPASARRSLGAVVVSTLHPLPVAVAVFHRGDPANYREKNLSTGRGGTYACPNPGHGGGTYAWITRPVPRLVPCHLAPPGARPGPRLAATRSRPGATPPGPSQARRRPVQRVAPARRSPRPPPARPWHP